MDLQEELRSQLTVPVVSTLGATRGLGSAQAVRIADEVLPTQLDRLTQLAQTPGGAQTLLNLARDRVPRGTVSELTSTPAGLARLQQAGAGLLPELMGPQLDTEVQRVKTTTREGEAQIRQMMELLLPLLLGLIARRAERDRLTPATLGTLFAGAALAGGAAAGTIGTLSATPDVVIEQGAPVMDTSPRGSGDAVGTPVGTVSSTPDVVIEQGAPVRPAPVTPPAAPVQAVQEASRRRGLGWLWWLLPLLLLLILGGCFLLRGKGVAPLALTTPPSGARVQGPLTFTGSGRAGETVTVSENGTAVTSTKVGSDGRYTATVPAPAPGVHTYTVSETGTDVTLNRAVTVGAAAASAPTAPATTTPAAPSSATSPAATPAAPVTAAGTTAPAATAPAALSFTTPAGATTVPTGGLTLSGNGPANTAVTVTEGGTPVGTARTDASGVWRLRVPKVAPGAHTYTAAAGALTSTLALTVANTAQTGVCTKTLDLALKPGERVRQPFRFGGVGRGKSYTVTVSRGAKQIGQKVLPLSSACAWGYFSVPNPGRITYTLRQTGETTVVRRITLNVRR